MISVEQWRANLDRVLGIAPSKEKTVNHFYQNIPGYFTYPDWYSEVARLAVLHNWKKIVEVGSHNGTSAAYLAVELENWGAPDGILDLVDWWSNRIQYDGVVASLAPVARIIGKLHRCASWDAALEYADHSVDCVFIDASHDYESVTKDIAAWMPKVKPGGYLSGHDYVEYTHPGAGPFGVIRAVHDAGLDAHPSFKVWPGVEHGGDENMKGKLWPCWVVQL